MDNEMKEATFFMGILKWTWVTYELRFEVPFWNNLLPHFTNLHKTQRFPFFSWSKLCWYFSETTSFATLACLLRIDARYGNCLESNICYLREQAKINREFHHMFSSTYTKGQNEICWEMWSDFSEMKKHFKRILNFLHFQRWWYVKRWMS